MRVDGRDAIRFGELEALEQLVHVRDDLGFGCLLAFALLGEAGFGHAGESVGVAGGEGQGLFFELFQLEVGDHHAGHVDRRLTGGRVVQRPHQQAEEDGEFS